MLDLEEVDSPNWAWPAEWAPLPEESFEAWWARNGRAWPKLDQEVVREWVYFNGGRACYMGLPIAELQSSLERWPTARLLTEVFSCDPTGGTIEFQRRRLAGWRESWAPGPGSWPTPPILLHTPEGYRPRGGPDRKGGRYVLLEGHRRFRLLPLLVDEGTADPEHFVWILRAQT